ncbi:RecX family transcriptional regulator [Sphingomonas sp. LaA6.9]|nr:RecX family transcriptional regulator [Sphingomonas sp. LaA6.9]MCJ8157142.1 RecX family transcriptional regulator [Sphingomonas sp. LaA6.9]
MAVSTKHRNSARPPLDSEALERLALHYVERYATTRARLRGYLERKLRERGWAGESEPPHEAIVARFAERGYVNDRLFAESRAEALARRGYGARRVDSALRIAGIEDADAEIARVQAGERAWDAALTYARRKKIGPFAPEPSEEKRQQKQLAAMLRAGHPFEFAKLLVSASPGECPSDPN